MDDTGSTGGEVYVLMLRDFVVLKDLEDTVREYAPAARVLTASECTAALALIEGLERISVAFVEAGAEAVAAARIDTLVAQRGGQVVLLGDDAEDAWEAGKLGADWPVLQRPFTSQTVERLLAELIGRPAEPSA